MSQRSVCPNLIALGLNEKEAEAVLWAAQGFPSRRVAELLNLKPRSVRARLRRSAAKLGCQDRDELIERALPLIKSEDVAFARKTIVKFSAQVEQGDESFDPSRPLSIGLANKPFE